MIEALVKYIQDKGYKVSVMTESLLIWKIAKGQRLNRNWGLSKLELACLSWDLLTYEADRQMDLIEKAIEQL